MGSIAPPEPRRVLLVSERADFYGGGQRSLCDLARALLRSSWSPVAVLPGPGPLAEALASEGVPVRHLPLPPLRFLRGARTLGVARRLAALLLAERAALIHSDAPRAALYAGVAARLAGRRHLWHLRASRPGAPGSDRLLLGLSHAVIAVSRAAATRSRALTRSPRVVVIPTGLRPADFLDRRTARGILDLPQEALVAGVVGRVEPDKGGEDAVAAAARLAAVAPGSVVAFLGAADPGSAYRNSLERQAERLGVAGSIRFLGERADAARLFRAFDLILHPSRHEALPRVLIEALWASVPTAAYSVGGVVEVVGTGVDAGGLLAPAGRPAAFTRLAERLALDPDLRRALGTAGAHRARERFSLDTMATAVVAQYDLLAAPLAGAAPTLREAA
jgi:glycosyltransferase involved in cell wall biosynthesis